MKVALVGPHVGHVPAQAAALARRGVDVTVHTVGPTRDVGVGGYRLVSMPLASGAAIDDTAALDDAAAVDDAALALRVRDFAMFLDAVWVGQRPDVVHADGWIYGVAAQLAADRHRVPTVQSLSTLGLVAQQRQRRTVGPPARARFERLLARSAHRVVVPCSDDVDALARLGCPRAHVSVVPRGVDLDAFDTVGPSAERTARRRVVAVAASLLPFRGLDDAITALSRLRDTELVIVGGPEPQHLSDDPDVARLRNGAAAQGVSDRVVFTGTLPATRIPAMLRSADVFVCPSWYESIGTATVEAMACGVPVVASDVGGMRDSVIHEVTGLHVPPRQPLRLALALNDVLEAGALRSGMGMSGRSRVRACYGWDRVAAEIATVYARAIASHLEVPAP